MKKLCTLLLVFVFLVGCSGNKAKFEFEGNSMLPTIKNQQTVIVDLNYYQDNQIKRGDLVLFNITEEDKHIKRVIGLPNEIVLIREGKIYVNENEVDNEFVFSDIDTMDNRVLEKSIKLKKNEYFLIGDNAPHSVDSRVIGPVDRADILGKVEDISKN